MSFHETMAGVPIVSGAYRHFEAITPSDDALPVPIDGFYVTANANVTVASVDDPEATVTFAAIAGFEYRLRCSKVTTVSTGTLIGCWHALP